MKKYTVLTTIHFKRSNTTSTYKETYLINNNQDITEAVKQYNKENGNHDVVSVEVLKCVYSNYRARHDILINRKEEM